MTIKPNYKYMKYVRTLTIITDWLYIRAEFPQPFTPYIDTLLQYVKNY